MKNIKYLVIFFEGGRKVVLSVYHSGTILFKKCTDFLTLRNILQKVIKSRHN